MSRIARPRSGSASARSTTIACAPCDASLPRSIRGLLNLRLHDAKVLALSFDESLAFSIRLTPDGAKDGSVELRYRLAAPPRLIRHVDLAKDGKPLQWGLYDELDVKDAEFAFSHSVLFSGGYELQLRFYKLVCNRLIRASWPATGTAPEKLFEDLADRSA